MAAPESNASNNLLDSFNTTHYTENFTPTDSNKVWLETILRKETRDEEINKIVEYESTKATAKGDNYTSELTRVTMKVVLGNGKTKMISVIIKELPSTEFRRAAFGDMGIYLKEIVMYRDILPNMSDIMNEFCDYSEPLWGRYLDYRPYDRIVLQDISKLGYKMNDRRLGLDYAHSTLVMRSLAKFHALSVILKTRRLIPMEVLGLGVLQRKEVTEQFEQVYQKLLENFIQTIEGKWEPEWKPVADRIRKIIPDILGSLAKLLVRDENKFNVLNHGDCWLNNIMFKHGIDSETPITLRFVDYQLCFFNTPAYDLQYFLSTTPNYEVRSKYKMELIEEYHKYLVKFLEFYNYKGNIISLETLNEEMVRLSLFSVINGLILLPLMLIENTESVPDLEVLFKDHVETKKLNMDWLPVGGETYTKYVKLLLKEAIDCKKI